MAQDASKAVMLIVTNPVDGRVYAASILAGTYYYLPTQSSIDYTTSNWNQRSIPWDRTDAAGGDMSGFGVNLTKLVADVAALSKS